MHFVGADSICPLAEEGWLVCRRGAYHAPAGCDANVEVAGG